MGEIVEIISNNGIAVGCVMYLIYFQLTTMKDITKALQDMTMQLIETNEKLAVIWEKIND